MAVINSAGPLTRIEITSDLNNAVNHVGDVNGEWFGNTASGTFLAVDGTLYGPANVPAGGLAAPRTPFTPLGQSGPSGTGTAGNPYTPACATSSSTTASASPGRSTSRTTRAPRTNGPRRSPRPG
jgi:hypothetical protein